MTISSLNFLYERLKVIRSFEVFVEKEYVKYLDGRVKVMIPVNDLSSIKVIFVGDFNNSEACLNKFYQYLKYLDN